MTISQQSLQEGNLEQALAQLQDQVRKEPAEGKHRIYLFQLLSVLGQWDRALNQLNVLADMDASTLAMVQTYREALRCEVLRADVFAGKRSALVFGDPEQWVALLMEALRLDAKGNLGEAQALRDQALEAAPATGGSIDGQGFAWIADADLRLGPVFEAIVNGKYYWVPYHRIRRIEIDEPSDLRDLVWLPALFTWANGGQTVGLIPARYPGSETSEDSQIRLAHKTDWSEHGERQIGLGQRLLATDVDDYAIMDIRRIELDSEAAEANAPAQNADDDVSGELDG